MCQTRSPSPGKPASSARRCRDSSRKYSLGVHADDESRSTGPPTWAAAMVSWDVPVVSIGVTQPSWNRDQAQKSVGLSPPPPHDPAPITHHIPTPSERYVVS